MRVLVDRRAPRLGRSAGGRGGQHDADPGGALERCRHVTAGSLAQIEQHDLEDMQGVLGLRAYRVAVRREVPVASPIEGRRPSLRAVEEIVVGRG